MEREGAEGAGEVGHFKSVFDGAKHRAAVRCSEYDSDHLRYG